ncbi:MAG: TonB family protein [Woeseiaceae bacterium]
MFAKYATAIPAGAAMTLTLLFAMHSLIAMQSGAVTENSRTPQMIFLRDIPVEELITEEFEKPDKPELVDQPALPETTDTVDDGIFVPVGRKPPIPTGDRSGQTISFMSDGPLITIVRVQPAYPAIAMQRGLEGFVVVAFDVFPDGTVGNITVVESSSSIFERSAMQAAKRFRYKARVVDGESVMTSGVQYRFRFEMND